MDQTIIYKCGQKVKINDINIFGYITGINIRNNNTMYEVSYYMNNNYYVHWFYDYQLDFGDESIKIKIGFEMEK
jgi:hypothetical protein